MSKVRRAFVAVAVALVGVLPYESSAHEGAAQLERINAEVESANARLAELVEQRLTREKALKTLRVEVSKLRKEEAELNRQVEAGLLKKAELDKEMGRLGREMERLRVVAVQRVRALYVYRNRAVADHIIGAATSGELLKNAYLLAKVSAYDRELLAEMRQLVTANESVQRQLVKVNGEQLRLKQELNKRATRLKGKVAEEERLMAAIEREKVDVEGALAALRAQALRLEAVLVSLIEGEVVSDARGSVPAGSVAVGGTPVEPFEGSGLDSRRGKLARPVKGEVVTPFGRTKRAQFEDYVFSKGQEYRGDPGAPVTAVGSGRVLHLGPMPGYGTIVIIDHGARSYSLYGKMGEISAQRGQDVSAGEVLGRLPSSDGMGGNLYFEIRKNGTPVDPGPYFR